MLKDVEKAFEYPRDLVLKDMEKVLGQPRYSTSAKAFRRWVCRDYSAPTKVCFRR